MSEKKDIRTIKTKLGDVTAEAPSFDALFRDEVPGEARLRRISQSMLTNHAAEAPSFESLLAPSLPAPAIVTAPHHRGKRYVSYTLWATGLAVAACLGLLLLLPNPLEEPQQRMGSALHAPVCKQVLKKSIALNKKEEIFLTQAITTPIQIKQLHVPSRPNLNDETPSDGQAGDSTLQEQLVKLKSADVTLLDAGPSITIDEAYAKARLAKKRMARGKMQAGVNMNSSNRLLSFVNTNQGSDPLLSTTSNYSKGLNVLDGSQGVKLRSAVTSKNVWEAPSNILPSSLENYEATYSLPINVGLSLSIPLSGLIELQTGCYYTYMNSRTEGMTGTSSFTLSRNLHYVGIPVRLAFNIYQVKGLRIYMALGGAIEKGLKGSQTSTVTAQNGDVDTWTGTQPVYGVQPSTNGLAGISYEYPSGISLYLEPGASYCYNTDQPTSIRTEEPFSFNLGLGLRYRLK